MNATFLMPEPSYMPIHDMQFQGLHWIEASAGTGKTYTLSSLMVRIFLSGYLPQQVVATTFTRAAAAELKTRIRLRVQEALRYLEPLRDQSESELKQKRVGEQDPLFQKLLDDYAIRIDFACSRLKLVLDQLDELFVGTLDSFCQKLLREFSFESGKIEHANITDDAKQYSHQLIHDSLREWIQSQPQYLIDVLVLAKKLHQPEYYIRLVDASLNFSAAKLQAVEMPQLNMHMLEQSVTAFGQLGEHDILALKDFTATHKKIMSKACFEQIELVLEESLQKICEAVQRDGMMAYFQRANQTHLLNLYLIFLTKKLTPRSKILLDKCPAEIAEQFEQLKIIATIQQLIQSKQQFEQQLAQVEVYLQYYLAHEVRKRLPQVLQEKGETTFAQQIRTLAEALEGEQGQRFAQFVHARYPLILVDEFQDTNQDQDNMLAQIWRHTKWYAQGCMIMVGDPKQAIYGFRGGDMLTYNKARHDVLLKQGHLYSLKYNHRSVRELVQVVDALFQRQVDFGEEVSYQAVEAGPRPHPALIEQGQINPAPLRWIVLEDQDDPIIQVAWKIRTLLNQGMEQKLYFQDKEQRLSLSADDIAVLSKNNDNLDQMQYQLQRLGIAVNRASKRSVFDSFVAKDVAAILTAILDPHHEHKVKRALLSRLLNFNLTQLMQLEQHPDGLSQYMADFDYIREMWINKGFLTAWQYCLNLFQVWENLVRYRSFDNERVVVNLRHLTEILSRHSERYGMQTLYLWYLKQVQAPSEREWEKERHLSHAEGVQLMTIHQSKGLEFKVVFLLGADSSPSDQGAGLNFSVQEKHNPQTGKNELERVVAVKSEQLTSQQIVQHDARNTAEQHRLWYVALTRASHRVYAILRKKNASSTHGLAFWRYCNGQVFEHPYALEESSLTDQPVYLKSQRPRDVELHAQSFPKRQFFPRSKTSFSALSQHLSHSQAHDALALQLTQHDAAADENLKQTIVEIETYTALAWIKQYFPKGTEAGNFLHQIFEHIDFQDTRGWKLEVQRRFNNDYPDLWQKLQTEYQQQFGGSTEILLDWMVDWLKEIVTTPLYEDFSLACLGKKQHLSEFPFCLSLADQILGVKKIHTLFADEGHPILDLNPAHTARYLVGSIDLMYYDGQRYHIADYKSNYLGHAQQHYSHLAIENSMSQASYWLQAGLYLVALHRYLKRSLKGYQIHKHLGGASYLYLRGMNGSLEQGYVHWKPKDEFILKLDALLGYSIAEHTHEH